MTQSNDTTRGKAKPGSSDYDPFGDRISVVQDPPTDTIHSAPDPLVALRKTLRYIKDEMPGGSMDWMRMSGEREFVSVLRRDEVITVLRAALDSIEEGSREDRLAETTRDLLTTACDCDEAWTDRGRHRPTCNWRFIHDFLDDDEIAAIIARLAAASPSREGAGLDAAWYVERFEDGSTFDWFAQLRRTLAAYERNHEPGEPFSGDIDLAEALTALHRLDALQEDSHVGK
jgi:hypothetical protein